MSPIAFPCSRSRRPAARAVMAAALALAAAAAAGSAAADAPARRAVVLVAVDGLRADALGASTPALDRLASGGAVFTRAYAQQTWALPSLATLLTSEYPETHGLNRRGARLDASATLLAESFRGAGWRTAGFFGASVSSGAFASGFDSYAAGGARTIGENAAAAAAFLRVRADGGVFVVVHGGAAGADAAVAAVWKALEDAGLGSGAVVAVAGAFGAETGATAPADPPQPREALTRVALVLRSPGAAPRRVDDVVELVDVAPTLLELSGLRAPASFQGVSLASLFGQPGAGGARHGRPYAFGASTAPDAAGRIPLYAARDARWELVYDARAGVSRLYDLARDPGETSDASDREPEKTLELVRALLRHIRESSPGAKAREPSPELLEKLRKAGYW